MKAFTHLCKRVNISLMNDVITLYCKDPNVLDEIAKFVLEQSFNGLFGLPSLGYKEIVHQGDQGHDEYHQDTFDQDVEHSHLRFDSTINETKFREIVNELALKGIVDEDEKTKLMNAYHQSNLLPNHTKLSKISLKSSSMSAKTGVTLKKLEPPVPEPVVIEYSPEEERVINELDHLRQKAVEFSAKSVDDPCTYFLAAETTQELYNALKAALDTYCAHRTSSHYLIFKETCRRAIEDARPILETHRGMKQILGNLLLLIAGVGIIYLIMGAVNQVMTGKFLFFSTDSANKLDSVQNSLSNIPEPMAG